MGTARDHFYLNIFTLFVMEGSSELEKDNTREIEKPISLRKDDLDSINQQDDASKLKSIGEFNIIIIDSLFCIPLNYTYLNKIIDISKYYYID